MDGTGWMMLGKRIQGNLRFTQYRWLKNKAMGFGSHSFFSCRFWAVSVVHIGAYMWAYFAF